MNSRRCGELAHKAAQHLLQYPFRVWGFGEGIGVRALLATGDRAHLGFVGNLFTTWLTKGGPRAADGHIAPGVELLELYRQTEEPQLLDAAHRLAELHLAFPQVAGGIRLHRADQPGFRRQIWVDCMHVDGPFLARYAHVAGKPEFFDCAADQLLAYARVLQEPGGLFRHGWEQYCGPNGQLWARGNGWALTGLLDTSATLPAGHPALPEIRGRAESLLRALARHQRFDGLFHTILDDQASYPETTLAAMLAYALAGPPHPSWESMRRAAETAVLQNVSDDGVLQFTSEATPVAEARMYATRPFGVYPWGQGPLLLTLLNYDDENENRKS